MTTGPGIVSKRCSKCRRSRRPSEFSRKRGTPDGLQYDCKSCVSKYDRERRRARDPHYGALAKEREEASRLSKRGRKRCSACAEVLPTTEFSRDESRRDGLYPYCRKCKSEASRRSARAVQPRIAENDRARLKRRELRELGLKVCAKCRRTLSVDDFSPGRSGTLDGRRSRCKSCSSADTREKYLARPGTGGTVRRRAEEDELRSLGRKKCAGCRAVLEVASFNKNRQRRDGLDRLCRVCRGNSQRALYKREQKAIGASNKRYRERNRPQLNKQRTNRLRTDREFHLRHLLRTRLYQALRRQLAGKRSKTAELLGCSIADFRSHVESMFGSAPPHRDTRELMSWSNQGRKGWHLDHIRPLASFDLTNPEDLAAAMHYTNFQPLWYYENVRKGDRWEGSGLGEEER